MQQGLTPNRLLFRWPIEVDEGRPDVERVNASPIIVETIHIVKSAEYKANVSCVTFRYFGLLLLELESPGTLKNNKKKARRTRST